jgi:serine protease Do
VRPMPMWRRRPATRRVTVPDLSILSVRTRSWVSGLRSEAGPVDVAYRGGLDDYFAGQYSDAADEFQRVLDIQPDNKMASEYRVKAIAAYNQFGDKGSLGLVGWLLIGAGALVVVVAVFTVLLVRRSRKRRAPDATTAQAGTAQPQQSYAGPWPAGALIPTQRLGEEPTPTRSFGDWTAGPSSPAVGFPVPTPGRAESSTTGSDATASSRSAAPVATASPTLTESGDAGDAPTSEGVAVSPSMGFCPNCGTPRTSGARFCGSCGHQV